jgi:hypothetical protein
VEQNPRQNIKVFHNIYTVFIFKLQIIILINIGYMDGAVESGERAANEILYLLFKGDNSIKCDYEKTYYFHREKLKFNSTFRL